MDSDLIVHCDWPSSMEAAGYVFRNEDDKLRNAMVVPRPVLDRLNLDDFEYVEARADDGRGKPGVVLHVLSFQEAPSDGPPWKASTRTNLMEALPGAQPAEPVAIRRHQVAGPDMPLRAYPGYSDDISGYDYCYLSDDVRRAASVSPGEYVEVFNPRTGGRIPLKVQELQESEATDKIRMSGQARNVLQVSTGETVQIRECVQAQSSDLEWWENLLSPFVGYRELGLRVRPGLDRDEHRNAVRISEDVMELLAIDPGDQLVLDWNRNTTSVRCLPPEKDDLNSMEIKVPSTIRDRFDVSIHDAVTVRRNMLYFFNKQVALSALGILGVIIGGTQMALYLELPVLGSLGLIVFASLFIVWLLLLPERQRCARGA